jgi:hypothetical protein
MERTGDPVRTEKVNNIRTDFTGNYKKSLKFYHITQTPVDKEDQAKSWYEDYFRKMQKKLKFKDNIRHRAMNMYVDNLLRRKIDREKTAREE